MALDTLHTRHGDLTTIEPRANPTWALGAFATVVGTPKSRTRLVRWPLMAGMLVALMGCIATGKGAEWTRWMSTPWAARTMWS